MYTNINFYIFYLINSLAGKVKALDIIGIILAKYVILLFVIFILFLWFKKKKNISLFCVFSLVLGMLINYIIKIFYHHTRPFVLNIGTSLISHSISFSFPSNHTTFMLSIAIMLIYFKKTKVTGIILSLVGIISGVARIFCGVHFPFDIIGSIFVAVISSLIIYLFREKINIINKYLIRIYKHIFNIK